MIHSSNIKKVIDLFKSVLPMATREGHLRMDMPLVNNAGHACGTVHCHGGWFAIACGLHKRRGVSFWHGVDEMVNILGFESGDELQIWAADNPAIWGNENGYYMFSSAKAFNAMARPEGAKNLQHIIDHWTEVYYRVLATENPIEFNHPPMTV